MNPEWPDTISPQAQQAIAAIERPRRRPTSSSPPEQMRAMIGAMQEHMGQPQLERYGVSWSRREMGGVPVRMFTPPVGPGACADRRRPKVLLNLHGGGFVAGFRIDDREHRPVLL